MRPPYVVGKKPPKVGPATKKKRRQQREKEARDIAELDRWEAHSWK